MAQAERDNGGLILGMFPSRLDLAMTLVAVFMGLYHLINVYYSVVGTIEHRMIHLAFAVTLLCVGALMDKRGGWLWWMLLGGAVA
ncbi:MAG: hypothetical protein ABIK12_11350, partial [Pseudomonadota bacterium]